jgi:tetraacyldisaccharide 4'-kinase
MGDSPHTGDDNFVSSRDRFLAGGGGLSAALARAPLRVASILYRGIVGARNVYYDVCDSAVARVGVPVISVGNITTGGTGKTPLVIELVTRLIAAGKKPAVVSRGYKSDTSGHSDELTMMKAAVPDLACVANVDRVAGAQTAIQTHGADVIVLDDGFQHRRIARDLDIVLIDATRPFGFGQLLPRGYLREPVANLRRADLIIITRSDQAPPDMLDELSQELKRQAPALPIIASRHKPLPLRPLGPGDSTATVKPCGPVYLLSGLGNHQAFHTTVATMGVEIRGHGRFPDHHNYVADELREACATAERLGAKAILTTEKDAVKLERLAVELRMPVLVLGVKIDFCDDGVKIIDQMLSSL